jgi:hypothetical protein
MIIRYLVKDKKRLLEEFDKYAQTAVGLPKDIEDLTFSLDTPNPEFYILNIFGATVVISRDPIVISIDMAGKIKDINRAKSKLEKMTGVEITRE